MYKFKKLIFKEVLTSERLPRKKGMYNIIDFLGRKDKKHYNPYNLQSYNEFKDKVFKWMEEINPNKKL